MLLIHLVRLSLDVCLGSHGLDQTRTLRSTLLSNLTVCYQKLVPWKVHLCSTIGFAIYTPPQTARMLPHIFQGSPSTAMWTTEAAIPRWNVKQVAATVNLCSQKESVVLSIRKCTSVLCNRYQKTPQDYFLMYTVTEPKQIPDSNLVIRQGYSLISTVI